MLKADGWSPGSQEERSAAVPAVQVKHGKLESFLSTRPGLQTNRTDDKSYGLLISLGQTVRRQIVRSALIRGGQIVRID